MFDVKIYCRFWGRFVRRRFIRESDKNPVIRVYSLRSCSVFSTPSSPTPPLIPDCRCDVKGTLSGVTECQQVRTRKPGRDKHLFIKLSFRLQSRLTPVWLKPFFVCVRKVGTVTASQTCTDIHATPARTDTSCYRKRITLAAKVGH